MNIAQKMLKAVSDPDYRFLVMASHGLCNKMPDDQYLARRFQAEFGYPLDLSNPKTFNEKLQWLKLYDRTPEYTAMVDKYEAKKYVAGIIGEQYIIPTLSVWDSFDEIDFDKLPNQFVLKCTHDSGGLVVCRDKETLDFNSAKQKIEKSLRRNYFWVGREWPYKGVRPRIIAEMYMEDEAAGNMHGAPQGLTDYKFFCFNGKPELLYISVGLENHSTAKISFYDLNGNEMPFHRDDYQPYHNAPMPDNLSEMKEVAEKLASAVDSPFVRIDLYSINGSVYFSEITFSPCSGMIPFSPASADLQMGKMLTLPEQRHSK